MKVWALCATVMVLLSVSASAQRASREVVTGERIELTASAVDPDGDPLTYTWTTTGGRIIGSGPRVTFDATGLAPGTYTATVTVSDSICEESSSVAITVLAPPPPPAPEAMGRCDFGRNNARVSNVCKAVLDDVALRARQNPRVAIVVDGHAASGERSGVALRRAEAVRDYLVAERGVDAQRVVVRSFDDRCAGGPSLARRVEIHLLPEGATADDVRSDCP